YKILVSFKLSDGTVLEAEYPKKLDSYSDAKKFIETLKDADFTVLSVEQKPGKKRPSAPFTTSTLQQEASQKLGYPVRMTMSLAQRLYESGYITYMRTDSF